MSFLFKRWVLFLSITALGSADKDTVFRPDAAARYPHHQTNATVTIAADPYVSGEKVQTAFGKLNPYEHGILPVLVVIQNDGNQSIRLDRIRPVYSGPQGAKVEALQLATCATCAARTARQSSPVRRDAAKSAERRRIR